MYQQPCVSLPVVLWIRHDKGLKERKEGRKEGRASIYRTGEPSAGYGCCSFVFPGERPLIGDAVMTQSARRIETERAPGKWEEML